MTPSDAATRQGFPRPRGKCPKDKGGALRHAAERPKDKGGARRDPAERSKDKGGAANAPPLFASAKGGRGERSETQGVHDATTLPPLFSLGIKGEGAGIP